jgi:hypothetical protein
MTKKALIVSVLLALIPALGFSQTQITGTYRYTADAYVTFTGNAFAGSLDRNTPISGTFAVSGSRLTLTLRSSSRSQNVLVWTIADAITLLDQANNRWVKSASAAAPAQDASGTETRTYKLGDTGPAGGKIFYYSAEGFTMTDNGQVCHYLEAWTEDEVGQFTWLSPEKYIRDIFTGSEGRKIGAGRKNTALILAKDNRAPAARRGNFYKYGGKSDWFLPSIDELTELYKNKDLIGNMLPTEYWSSTDTNVRDAFTIHFGRLSGSSPSPYESGKYSDTAKVRVIRAF